MRRVSSICGRDWAARRQSPSGVSEDVAVPWPQVIRRVVIALVLLVEWQAVQVTTVDPEAFAEYAVEIEHTTNWRYGYVLQRHGAVLVKTRPGTRAQTSAPRGVNDDIAREMSRTLHLLGWKAVFELSFYALLLGMWDAGVARWRRRFASHDISEWRRSAAFGGLWAVLVAAALAPYVLTGYGDPLFSSWRGPGAMSYSMWLGSAVGPLGPALTYRAVVLFVVTFPLMGLGWAGRFLAPIGEPAALWIVSVVFHGCQAAALHWAVGATDTPQTDTPTG